MNKQLLSKITKTEKELKKLTKKRDELNQDIENKESELKILCDLKKKQEKILKQQEELDLEINNFGKEEQGENYNEQY